ncbi:MAG: sigma-70 family RNA polymerase sigma factor [Candidatus Kapabacteria bacterium]|nr:sigma-70 family RNA polymerase sigma factor [Candidatus Kapabacteria bacterium]
MSDEEICNCENIENKFRFGFAILYKRYNSKLHSKCTYKLPSADSDEILQETWIKVFQYINSSEKPIDNFKGILYKSFDYACKEYIRNSKKEHTTKVNFDFETLTSADSYSEENEQFEKVMSILNSLPTDRKEQFLLRYQDKCSWHQISEKFNTSAESIRKYCERLKKQIQNITKKPSK